jgi:5-methylcytosine-specific restriction protein A
MILFLLFFGSLIFLMLYYYPYFDLISMWIKNNGVYISIIIFLGSIFLSWLKKKNYYNPTIFKNMNISPNNNIMKQKVRRNVSNSLKKIVASSQKWKCGDCEQLLDYTYEIDHKIPLFKGGNNEISNLLALCRLCHGRKTILELNNK